MGELIAEDSPIGETPVIGKIGEAMTFVLSRLSNAYAAYLWFTSMPVLNIHLSICLRSDWRFGDYIGR